MRGKKSRAADIVPFDGGDQDHGVAEADDDGAVGLLGDFAGFEKETLGAELHFDASMSHESTLTSLPAKKAKAKEVRTDRCTKANEVEGFLCRLIPTAQSPSLRDLLHQRIKRRWPEMGATLRSLDPIPRRSGRFLLPETEATDDAQITGAIFLANVIEKAGSLADHHEKAAARTRGPSCGCADAR